VRNVANTVIYAETNYSYFATKRRVHKNKTEELYALNITGFNTNGRSWIPKTNPETTSTGKTTTWRPIYEGVSKSFRTGSLERELQMVQHSATRRSYIAVLWVGLVSFPAITVCVVIQRVFIFVVVYFVIDSVRKLLDTPSLNATGRRQCWGETDHPQMSSPCDGILSLFHSEI